jgi:lysozyme family protein
MADTATAVQFVLRQEDSRLTGAITTLKGDRGGRTRFGLAERFHPDLVKSGYYDIGEDGEPVVPHDEALAIADQFTRSSMRSPLSLDRIESQDVANRLLSFAINEGPAEGIAVAQKACNALGCSLGVDGKLGPATLKALNSLDPEKWIAANRIQQENFYRHLVQVRPEMAHLLNGLLNRADA